MHNPNIIGNADLASEMEVASQIPLPEDDEDDFDDK